MADDGKKRKLYFTPMMDIMMLNEVIQRNPFQHGNSVYGTITENLKRDDCFKTVERRSIQDRTERLIKVFRSEQLQSLKRSGTEEQYDERERLLQEVSDLEAEWRAQLRVKRAADQATPSAARLKAARMMGPEMQARLTPLKPTTQTRHVVPSVNPEHGSDQDLTAGTAQDDGQDNTSHISGPEENFSEQGVARPRKTMKKDKWSSTLTYLESKFSAENEMKKEELVVKRLEAENERVRLQITREEQEHRQRQEEIRRKEESDERRLLMDRQNKLMDAMFSLLQKGK